MRVSARGYGVLAAGVALLGAGFTFGYPELAALGTAAVVAVAGALVFVAWRPRLAVARTAQPDRVRRGQSTRITLSISNGSRVLGATLLARDRVSPGGLVAVPVVRLRARHTTRVSYPVPTRRRGVIRVGPLEASRRDPLGLVEVIWRYGDAVTVWVRPRVHPITNVPVGLARSMDGRVDRVPEGNITFSTLRDYVIGDDLRHVHWRTSARMGSLMVREHVDTSIPTVVILLDNRSSAHAPGPDGESTFEASCEAAASVLAAAAREEVRVELRLLHGGSASGRGEVQTGPLLDLLAEADLVRGPEADLRAAVERLRAQRVGDTLIFLTGPRTEDDLPLLSGLRGSYPSIIAGVCGAREPTPTAGAEPPPRLTTDGAILIVIGPDAAAFARTWDGIRAW